MLAKGQRPIIGRLSELLVSRCRPAFLDTGAASPTSHFDLSPSPRGNLKNYNAGVGLGIVAALDSSTSAVRGGCEILVKHAVCSPKLNSGRRPTPIPIALAGGSFPPPEEEEDEEIDNVEENYTYVTTRGPLESSTRVYYDGGLIPGRKSPPTPIPADQPPPRRTPDFLRSCHLCGKNLEGKDIYMYRGESAFCSPECRSCQIVKDEMKERCRGSEAETVSNSPYNRGIFSTGIVAI